MDQASLQPLRAVPVPLRGGSNHLRRWLARERAKAMQPRYVATMVVEMRWLGPLTLPGRLL
jgi:hypothetical protein